MEIIEKKEKKTNPYSFRSAFESIPRNRMKDVKVRIKELLNVKSDKAFYDRMSGAIEPKVSQAKDLELLFEGYGVILAWGKGEEVFVEN